MFYNYPKDFQAKELLPGWMVHYIVGDNMSFTYHTIQPNTTAKMHTHPNEQLGIIIDGEFEMVIGDEKKVLKKGDMYRVPPNAVHGGYTHAKKALIFEAFSPPRDYAKI